MSKRRKIKAFHGIANPLRNEDGSVRFELVAQLTPPNRKAIASWSRQVIDKALGLRINRVRVKGA